MKRTRSYLLFWFLMLSLVSNTQEITNVHFEQVGKQIHIYYDLQGDQVYTIQVLCSTNDGKSWGNPLKYVSGAIGENQKPGNAKMIVWDVLAEREKLSGNIRFKIEALPVNSGFFTDTRDGQTYKWVKIGEQVWMDENLNYKTTNGSWVYNNKSKNAGIYGRLYNWKKAIKSCPDGWYLPTDNEWRILVNFLEVRGVAGGKMKDTGKAHWKYPNKGATNESGFSALPGGYRSTNGSFSSLGYDGYWWSATEYSSSTAWRRNLYYSDDKVYRNGYYKGYGFSVRCLRD